MSWVGVAGGVVGAVGSLWGAKKSGDAAQDAAQFQYQASKEALDFEKQRYQEWQETYGPLEDNLSEYYKQLSPMLREVQGLEAYEKEKNVALTNLRENLAQRGLDTSGIAADVETSFAIESAAERARIRAEAPMETAREQLNFLQVGLGQNPANSVGAALQNRASDASATARDTARAASQASQAAWEAGASVAEDIVNIFTTEE